MKHQKYLILLNLLGGLSLLLTLLLWPLGLRQQIKHKFKNKTN